MKIIEVRHIIIVLLMVSQVAFSQIRFEKAPLAVPNILMSTTINQTTQDADGYIWIASRDGLMRYDGCRAVDFTLRDTDGEKVVDANIGVIHFAPETNRLWMSTGDFDVLCLDLNTYAYVSPAKKEWDEAKLGWTQNSMADADGYRFRCDTQRVLTIESPGGETTELCLVPDSVIADSKMYLYSVAKRDSLLYIATYGAGLYIYGLDGKRMAHYGAEDDEPLIGTNYLTHCFVDNAGNVWLSTEGDGMNVIRPKYEEEIFSIIELEPHRSGGWDNYVSYIDADSASGNITVGTRAGRLYAVDSATMSVVGKSENGYVVNNQAIDRRGRKLLGLNSGLMIDDRMFTDLHTLSRTPHSAGNVQAIAIDSRNRIWLATLGGLRLMYLKDGKPEEMMVLLDADRNVCRVTVLLLRGSVMFIGTSGGLFSIDVDADGDIGASLRKYDLPFNQIVSIEAVNDSTLWLGTRGSGLMRVALDRNLKIKDVKVVDVNSGLCNNRVTSVKNVGDDYLLAGTECGVSLVNTNTMLATSYMPFGIGLSNRVSSAIDSLPDGRLLIGTAGGLMVFDKRQYDALLAKAAMHAPRLTGIVVNGHSVYDIKDGLHLDYTQNAVDFQFSNFQYGADPTTLYQYYLDGYDDGWRQITSEDHAAYENLPPGKYVFHLRSLRADGQWSERVAQSVNIAQPWWNTPWAWLAYAAFAIAVVLVAYGYLRRRYLMNKRIHEMELVEKTRMEFFTAITHEFRTPLAIIDGAARRVVDKDGIVSKGSIQMINRSVKRLLRLVNQFLDFRKLSTGNYRLRLQEGDIIAFARDIYYDFKLSAEQKRISMSMIAFAKSYRVCFDRQIVDSVICNLLSNACKYTPQGGVVSFKIRLDEDGNIVMLVEDNGPGIPAEKVDRLFTMFMGGHASQGGMGIGLANSKKLAVIHHGDLVYEPVPGGGCCFKFSLPSAPDAYGAGDFCDEPEAKDDPERREDVYQVIRDLNPNAINDRMVALIEDDEDMLRQISDEVGQYFRVAAYRTRREALDGLEQNPPSLLISDIMLPDGNGYDLVKTLKANPRFKDVPVIMLTSLADEENMMKGYKAGADDYMGKPCSYPLLILRIIQLMRWYDEKRRAQLAAEPQEPGASVDEPILSSITDKKFLERLDAVVRANIGNPDFSISQAAESLHMGRTSFFGKVKGLTGQSPGKYIHVMRMEMAAQLITEGRLNISEVCYKVGISDAGYFTRLFKAHFGVVPSQYKKSNA